MSVDRKKKKKKKGKRFYFWKKKEGEGERADPPPWVDSRHRRTARLVLITIVMIMMISSGCRCCWPKLHLLFRRIHYRFLPVSSDRSCRGWRILIERKSYKDPTLSVSLSLAVLRHSLKKPYGPLLFRPSLPVRPLVDICQYTNENRNRAPARLYDRIIIHKGGKKKNLKFQIFFKIYLFIFRLGG